MNMGDGVHDDRETALGPKPDIERWLDDALAQYAKAEPRVGLEGRVLARLAATREESRQRLRWWGAWAFSAAAALALALLWLGRVERRLVPQAPVARTAAPPQVGAPTSGGGRSNADAEAHAVVRHVPVIGRGESAHGGRGHDRPGGHRQGGQRPDRKEVGVVEADLGPKLDQFPSPSPLTDQEKMLVRYVQDFPKKAELMARAQTELRRQDELEMAAPWPTKGAQSLEEQPE